MLGIGLTASGYISYDDFDALPCVLFISLFPTILTILPSLHCQTHIYKALRKALFFHPQHKQTSLTSHLLPLSLCTGKKNHNDSQAPPNTTNKMPVSCNQCRFRDERNNELLLCYHCLSQCHVCVSLSTNLIRFNTR